VLILDIINLAETGSDARFYRTFTKQMTTEAMDGAGEETLNGPQRFLDAFPLFR
jgi:hypothetical protein